MANKTQVNAEFLKLLLNTDGSEILASTLYMVREINCANAFMTELLQKYTIILQSGNLKNESGILDNIKMSAQENHWKFDDLYTFESLEMGQEQPDAIVSKACLEYINNILLKYDNEQFKQNWTILEERLGEQLNKCSVFIDMKNKVDKTSYFRRVIYFFSWFLGVFAAKEYYTNQKQLNEVGAKVGYIIEELKKIADKESKGIEVVVQDQREVIQQFQAKHNKMRLMITYEKQIRTDIEEAKKQISACEKSVEGICKKVNKMTYGEKMKEWGASNLKTLNDLFGNLREKVAQIKDGVGVNEISRLKSTILFNRAKIEKSINFVNEVTDSVNAAEKNILDCKNKVYQLQDGQEKEMKVVKLENLLSELEKIGIDAITNIAVNSGNGKLGEINADIKEIIEEAKVIGYIIELNDLLCQQTGKLFEGNQLESVKYYLDFIDSKKGRVNLSVQDCRVINQASSRLYQSQNPGRKLVPVNGAAVISPFKEMALKRSFPQETSEAENPPPLTTSSGRARSNSVGEASSSIKPRNLFFHGW